LAALYGVLPKRLNEQVQRNRERFPEDFILVIDIKELRSLRSHFATLDKGRGRHRKHAAFAFTEHGAIMAATVLNSPRAVEMTVYVVRAFVKLREVLASNVEMVHKLQALEKSVASQDARTRRQFEEVYAAIRALMAPPAAKSRPIGFTADITGKDKE
jgi:phage regulator Rha-like protein